MAGIEQPTLQSAYLSGNTTVFFETYGGKDYRGEGTVPRVSATPHDLSNDPREMYAATRHGPLQNADAVLTHLAGLILRLYLPLTTFLAPNVETVAKAKVSVAIEDFYWSGEPVVVKAKPDREGLGLELP